MDVFVLQLKTQLALKHTMLKALFSLVHLVLVRMQKTVSTVLPVMSRLVPYRQAKHSW